MVGRLVSEVKVVTDSASDIPRAVARDSGITVVPCNVHFGEKTPRDGVEVIGEEFFNELTRSPVLPTTSQPSVGLFWRRPTGDWPRSSLWFRTPYLACT